MRLFSWFSDLFSDDNISATSIHSIHEPIEDSCLSDTSGINDFSINPANGLPMVGGIGGVDVAGNSFGTDSHNDFDATCGHFNSLDDHLEMHDFGCTADTFNDPCSMHDPFGF